ncbi:MAG: hypothetical protein JWP96_1891 [Polaromonas sp.]|nr:hypothetical protein [Polaromonas sp.]
MLTLGLIDLTFLSAGASAQTIYNCVDAKGRSITADRPIAECIDRTQRELSTTGLVKRQLGPSLTAHEQVAQDEKDRQAAEVRAREAEEKRRDRALVQRYPTRAVHDQERTAALLQIDEVMKASSKRQGELAEQRKAIASELEFYLKNPSKAPASLKRRLEDNDSSVAVQHKFISDQEQEKKRVNLRFDEELVRLKQLWALRAAPMTAKASSPKPEQN